MTTEEKLAGVEQESHADVDEKISRTLRNLGEEEKSRWRQDTLTNDAGKSSLMLQNP